jgi:hypothetical protein
MMTNGVRSRARHQRRTVWPGWPSDNFCFEPAAPQFEPTRRHGANEFAVAGGRWRKRPKVKYHATIVDLARAEKISSAKGIHQRRVGAPGLGPGSRFLAHDVADQRRSAQ